MAHEFSQRLLTTQEAAERLGLSASTLAKLRLSGEGPRYRKLTRAVRYAEADLQAWSDARIRASTSDDGQRRAV